MSNNSKPKIPQQLIFDLLTMLIDNKPQHAVILDNAFGGRRLDERFHVHEPEKGKFMVLQELDNGLVRYVELGAVRAAVTKFTRDLPADYDHFKLTDKMKNAVDYWLHASEPFRHEIKPVLQRSQPGYTFKRLDFDPAQQDTPLFDDFLDHMETNRDAFLSFCGSLFDSTAQRQNYVWLYGQGNDGKGTWARFLHKIFGEAYAALSDDNRMHNQFWTYQCVGKRVGVFADCTNSKFVSSGLFQQLTGDDVVPCERKGKDVVGMRLDTMFFFLSNALPAVSTKRSALRRAIICTMRERTQDEIKDPHTYESRLWAERAGIVQKCIDAWQTAKAATGRIAVDESIAVDIAQRNEEGFDSVLARYFDLDPNGKVRKTDVFNILTTDARAPQWWVFEFYAWLERTHGVKDSQPRINGKQVRCFAGITFNKSFSYLNTLEAGDGKDDVTF